MNYVHIYCADERVVAIPYNPISMKFALERAIIRWDNTTNNYRTHHEAWKIVSMPYAFMVSTNPPSVVKEPIEDNKAYSLKSLMAVTGFFWLLAWIGTLI